MNSSDTNIIVWTFYKWAMFLLVLQSLQAWFFWNLSNPFIVPLIIIFISMGIIALNPNLFLFNRKSVQVIIFLYLLAQFGGTRGNLNAYIGMIINSLSVLIFAALKDKYKMEFLNFFTKAFAVLIGISLLGWIFHLSGVRLPNFEDTYGFSETRNEQQYFFDNYYLFVRNIETSLDDSLLPRFSSIFLESGYLGISLIIILYLNNFNLKNKYNVILLVALFFTFSLAGWLMGLFTYIAYALRINKRRTLDIVMISVGILAFYTFFSSYNNGNNAVKELILSRLEYDEENKNITGYNRTGEEFDDWFKNYFVKSPDIIFGTNMESIFGETSNVGWKVYMVNYGLVGIVLYLLFLYYVFFKNNNYRSFILFLLYIMIFARGHYIIFWAAFPMLYLCGNLSFKNESKLQVLQ